MIQKSKKKHRQSCLKSSDLYLGNGGFESRPLTQANRGFPQSIWIYRIVPHTRPHQVLSTSLSIHYLLLSYHSTLHNLSYWQFHSVHHKQINESTVHMDIEFISVSRYSFMTTNSGMVALSNSEYSSSKFVSAILNRQISLGIISIYWTSKFLIGIIKIRFFVITLNALSRRFISCI
jgi:hypothetical protein